MSGLFGGGLFHVLPHPIANLAVGDGFFHHFDHLFVRDAGVFEPHAVKALAEIFLVIGVQFAGKVQADFVKVTRQVAPAVHRFARAARVNDVAHGS